jgi:hypothetical protein
MKNGRYKGAGDFYNKISNRIINLNEYSRKDIPSTSHKVIAGENLGISSNVVIQPTYNASSQAGTDYGNKAYMSIDGILRPFSTCLHENLANFEEPEDLDEDISSITLNPLQSGNDIVILSNGTGVPDNGLQNKHNSKLDYSGEFPISRGIGLRLPAVGIGWGYTMDGKPTPPDTGVVEVTGVGGAILVTGRPADPDKFLDGHMYKSSEWKAGPIDLRWDEQRKVWTAGFTTIYLAKMTNQYVPSCFSYEVERAVTRTQYNRNAPSGRMDFDPTGVIYDPEYVAYTGKPENISCYEHLDYSDIEYPFYEAFIIRKTNEDTSIDEADYNIWYEDCNDCGHVTNPCNSHTKHGSPSARKKILIENPLRQAFDVGDLAFTVDTGKKKRVSGSTFIGGSGTGASGHFLVNGAGSLSFVIGYGGSDYTNGAFAVYKKPCVGLTLTCVGGIVTSGTISGSTSGYSPTGIYPVDIYPKNASLEYIDLPIHWVMQAELKTKQFVEHVECENGLMQVCTFKAQVAGFSSCSQCGEDNSLINNFI